MKEQLRFQNENGEWSKWYDRDDQLLAPFFYNNKSIIAIHIKSKMTKDEYEQYLKSFK